mgnify:CR=1 FL=1
MQAKYWKFYEDHTCLTFEELSRDDPDEAVIRFIRGSGCWTTVGRGRV